MHQPRDKDAEFFDKLGDLFEEYGVRLEAQEYHRGAHSKSGVPAIALYINETSSEVLKPYLLLNLNLQDCYDWAKAFRRETVEAGANSPGLIGLLRKG